MSKIIIINNNFNIIISENTLILLFCNFQNFLFPRGLGFGLGLGVKIRLGVKIEETGIRIKIKSLPEF